MSSDYGLIDYLIDNSTTHWSDRVTPNLVKELQPNEVFVFGANEMGIHRAGAAKQALKWGAKMYEGEGLFGQTYALPTKNIAIKTMSLWSIAHYADRFFEFAKTRPDLTFLTTSIGCGLAKYTPEQIAPLFKDAPENVHLPASFWEVLNKQQ